MPYSCKTLQSLSRRTWSYAFLNANKACKEVFAIFPRFLKDSLSEDLVRGAATRTKTTLSILHFWFHYFTAFLFKAFGIHFSWQTKQWYSSAVSALLTISRSPFLKIGMITPVCNSFGVLPNFRATCHIRVSQRIPSMHNAFNISGLISSSQAAFPDFHRPIATATSLAGKTFSSPRFLNRGRGRGQKI